MALNPVRLRRRLLAWFDRNRRDLPWRHSRDPYRIWVSEVMLQQTTVAAVVPYYERFLTAFPDVRALAAAPESDVLRLWEGLGYYRRARHLHQAGRRLVAEHGGQLLDDPAVWADLPGVGRYILGAVLSQAFDRRLPIVEANSLRVLCRLFAYAGDPKSAAGQKWLWREAERLLPRRRVGDFNQAMMELGATVCAPRQPACGGCPVRGECAAAAAGTQAQIPRAPAGKEITQVNEVAVILRRAGRVLLLQRRADASRWAGMWEFPHGERHAGETHEAAASRVLKQQTGIRARINAELMTIRHGVTRYRITMVAFEADYRGGRLKSPEHDDSRWLTAAQLAEYPVGSAQRRLAEAWGRAARQRRLF